MNENILSQLAGFYRDSIGNPHSSDHQFGWLCAAKVEKSATVIANLIGAEVDEVVWTSGATESNNFALTSLAKSSLANERKRILVSAIEHKCVLESANALAEHADFVVETIPVDSSGLVCLESLSKQMADDVLLVSVMAVNNEIGTVQDLSAISKIVRKHSSYFHTDAAQAPITMRVSDMSQFADLISLSSHKIGGPPGIGALYIRRDIAGSLVPLFHGGGQQGGLRSGTLAVPLCEGFAAAASSLMDDDIDRQRSELLELTQHFTAGLTAIDSDIQLNGPDFSKRHIGNANIQFPGNDAQDILLRLQPNLAASTGSACTSGIRGSSHVLREIGLSQIEARSSIRFSPGFASTIDDADEAIRLLSKILIDKS